MLNNSSQPTSSTISRTCTNKISESRPKELLTCLWFNKPTEYTNQHTPSNSTEKVRFCFTLPIPSETHKSTSSILTFSVHLYSNKTDESLIPLGILNYVLNPFELAWYWCSFSLYASPALVIPRIWYIADFKYHPRKLFLLRGGKVLKVEAQTLGNERYTYWFETNLCRPLTEDKLRFDHRDNADFLTEEGQLRYDVNV